MFKENINGRIFKLFLILSENDLSLFTISKKEKCIVNFLNQTQTIYLEYETL